MSTLFLKSFYKKGRLSRFKSLPALDMRRQKNLPLIVA